MHLKEYYIQYKDLSYYLWATNEATAKAIAIDNFKQALEVDETGETKWEFDDYV